MERTPSAPPLIAAVPSHVHQVQWSVMIPVYNALPYLQEALESVLSQGYGPDEMQVAVIDDCSTDGDVMALVQAIGGNRVQYFRQPQNVGSLRNFETCLNLSTGRWVHLLHGDDRILPGFYQEIEALFIKHPEIGAAFTNLVHSEPNDDALHAHAPLAERPGILKNFLFKVAQSPHLQPPAIVVKRSVYEQLGGFYAVHYGEDWEMWARIAANFPIAYSPKCLAHYRYLTSEGISSRSLMNGQNIKDVSQVIDIIQNYLPHNQRARLRAAARLNYALYCVTLAHSLYDKNPQAALLQLKGALHLSNSPKVFLLTLKYFVKDVVRYEQVRKFWKVKPVKGMSTKVKTAL